MLSGYFIEGKKQLVEGAAVYDFSAIRIFWVVAACCSLALLLVILFRSYRKRQTVESI